MNADPVVMEYYPSTLTAEESDAMVDRIEATFTTRGLISGFGRWKSQGSLRS
jgi:hypothetical protein